MYSRHKNAIFNSPDKDYVDLSGEARTFLDGICKKVQQSIPSSMVSPITNLTWRVTNGQIVLLEVVVKENPLRFEYSYLDGSGGKHTGVVDHKSKLLPLVKKVGR